MIRIFFWLFCSCQQNRQNPLPEHIPMITSTKQLNEHSSEVWIQGQIEKYMPASEGKGTHVQYFEYELVFGDSTRIPISSNVTIDTTYIQREIKLFVLIGNAPLHNKPCPPYCQNAIVMQLQKVISISLLDEE